MSVVRQQVGMAPKKSVLGCLVKDSKCNVSQDSNCSVLGCLLGCLLHDTTLAASKRASDYTCHAMRLAASNRRRPPTRHGVSNRRPRMSLHMGCLSTRDASPHMMYLTGAKEDIPPPHTPPPCTRHVAKIHPTLRGDVVSCASKQGDDIPPPHAMAPARPCDIGCFSTWHVSSHGTWYVSYWRKT